MTARKSVVEAQQSYLAALLAGDLSAARGLINEVHGACMSIATIYIDVLTPAQTRIGEMWHDG